MTLEQGLAFGILFLALVLFASGKLRHDIVALIALVAVGLAGLVEPAEIVSGFGHPAVITVAAVLVVSEALRSSGLVDVVVQRIEPLTKTATGHIAILTGVVALASSFMNNVGALAIMLPVALATATERGRPPAMLLMPIAFGSMLGGMITLIGTPPNIIIASFRRSYAEEPFHMFDFAWVGLPIAVIGILFIALGAWRLIPRERKGGVQPEDMFSLEEYVIEVRVRDKSPLAGRRVAHMETAAGEEIAIAARVREDGQLYQPESWQPITAGDLFILRADPAELTEFLDTQGLELVGPEGDIRSDITSSDLKLVEAIVGPNSQLIGFGPRTLARLSQGEFQLFAVARQGEPIGGRLHNVRFQTGDVLLLQTREGEDLKVPVELGLLPLPERGLRLGGPRRLGTAFAIFAGAIGLSMTGILPIAVAFIAAIVLYVIIGILPLRDLYRHIDWPVIVLLGAMIPVGQALQNTGADLLIAETIAGMADTLPVWAVVALLLIATMVLTDVVNNAATALIMAPISIAIAQVLDVNPDAFLMTIAIGASCAFLTPIGHQSNTLVMGPGGYKFSDYWRLGLPLETVVVLVAVPLIMFFWA
ncbi:MAG: SLC13 family permease [Parvibaculum sp.]|jgi:di/tricarboxylate transporter|uniref:SLC13 family permease n=1 Tax=Parvibaculum sp. TaxID=2024848 RepID=UPI000C3E4B3E|nr:SLC13 family permease [Parvibaculum sp.]MAU60761.1 SLC13 family permease [Parvibaculum sp.]|tara:strand:- start:2566 stop:4341 length:1776 start_codon:yes stop_codon:yes gene_type:complete